MTTIFLATFDVRQSVISATVLDRDCIRRPTCHGRGESILDAVSQALDNRRLCYRSEHDELDACSAAMRGRNFEFEVSDQDQVQSIR